MWIFLASLAGSFANFAVKIFDLRLELLTAKAGKERAKVAKQSVALAVIENLPAGKLSLLNFCYP